MENVLHALRTMPLAEAAALLLADNAAIFALVIAVGHLFARRYEERRVGLAPPPVRRAELALAVSNVFFNTAVTVLGLYLWRTGVIRFRADAGWRALLDVFVLLAVMDLSMYLLHRLAHTRLLFPVMHRTHHRFERVRPLTLFALSPVENLGFGMLWLLVISLYEASWVGMSAYLVVNVVFGAVGHLGVEPLPDSWPRARGLRQLTTSTFHAQHHQDLGHNYGFYTLVWDRLFGTLSPRYEVDFGRTPADALTSPGEGATGSADGQRGLGLVG